MGAFHSTKISENSGSKSNGTEIFRNSFRKFRFTSRGCPFFWKFGNSGVWHFYPVWIGPSSLSREKLQDGGESFESTLHTLDAKWSAIVRACSWSKTKALGSDENCGLVVPNFLWVSSPGLHTLPPEKFVSFSHKYQGRVEFWVCVNLLHTKQLNTAFETGTFIMTLSHFLK